MITTTGSITRGVEVAGGLRPSLDIWQAASDDNLYRYRLVVKRRDAGQHEGRLVWIMLNPSTASPVRLDPTMRRVLGFTFAHGYGECDVVNLFARRATKPHELKSKGWPTGGSVADVEIMNAVRFATAVVAAWGVYGAKDFAKVRRIAQVIDLCRAVGRRELLAIEVLSGDRPQHPLCVGSSARLQPWRQLAPLAATGGAL